MSEPPSAPVRRFSDWQGSSPRLESWKAIAEYLGRHVTTVQRWEQEEGLPVHRHQHEKRGSVYAYAHELDAWLTARSVATTVPAHTSVAAAGPAASQGTTTPTSAPSRQRGVIRVFAAVALGLIILGGIAQTSWLRESQADGTTSVAVLPLTNRSPDQQPDYFVDGMTEALVTDLASLPAVRVIARQSVMQYRNSGKAASTIARELNADALVEGAVQRSGERIRVNIRLIDGTTSRALSATTYERDVVDALALQAEISRAIVNELHLTLDPSQRERLANHQPSNPEAWDAYMRARFFWNKRTHSDMSRAIEWYERAIQRDPSFAMGYAGLADVYASLGPPNMAISELIARGTTAAEKAIELDPAMGEPFAALGKLRAYAWDWYGAESHFRKAIERAPGYAPARYWFGAFLANQGRCDEAFSEAREAERLDPISLPGNMVVSLIELRCHRVEQAISRSRMIVEFDPNFASSHELLGRAYLMQGRVPEATAMIDRALDLSRGRATVLAMRGYAYAAAGRAAAAEAIAAELAERHTRDKVLASAWSVAIAQAGLRRDDETVAWLEHAYADREEWLEALAVDERFRHLHGDPRFQRLLHRLGLPNDRPGVVTRW
jgi:TolB-like protein/Tfp pilus assembly protein PilF